MEHNTTDKLCQFHDSQRVSENQDLVHIWVSHSDSMEFWLSVEVQFSYRLGQNHQDHHVRSALNRGLQLQLKSFWFNGILAFTCSPVCLNHHHHHVWKVLNRGLQLQLKCTLLIDCLRCCWFEVRFRLVALPLSRLHPANWIYCGGRD